MSRSVVCPKCGALSNGDEFTVVIPYKAAAYGTLAEITDEGRLRVDFHDRGDPIRYFRTELQCAGCDHQWSTDRNWESTNAGF